VKHAILFTTSIALDIPHLSAVPPAMPVWAVQAKLLVAILQSNEISAGHILYYQLLGGFGSAPDSAYFTTVSPVHLSTFQWRT